jgi:hypothetical protein
MGLIENPSQINKTMVVVSGGKNEEAHFLPVALSCPYLFVQSAKSLPRILLASKHLEALIFCKVFV